MIGAAMMIMMSNDDNISIFCLERLCDDWQIGRDTILESQHIKWCLTEQCHVSHVFSSNMSHLVSWKHAPHHHHHHHQISPLWWQHCFALYQGIIALSLHFQPGDLVHHQSFNKISSISECSIVCIVSSIKVVAAYIISAQLSPLWC